MKKRVLLLIVLFCAGTIIGKPGDVVKTLGLKLDYQTGIAYKNKCLWLCDREKDSLFCYDLKKEKIIKGLETPAYWPSALAFEGEFLWTADRKTKKAYKIDLSTGNIVSRLELPVSNPSSLAWDGEFLWTAGEKNGKIMKIDPEDGTAVKIIPAPVRYCDGLAWDGAYLWVGDRVNNEIYMVSPEDGSVILIVDAPGPHVSDLSFDGRDLWVCDYETDSVYQIVRKDKERYFLDNVRKISLNVTHQVKTEGEGGLEKLNVSFSVPKHLTWQRIISVDFSEKGVKRTDQWGQEIKYFQYDSLPGDSVVNVKMAVEADLFDVRYFIFPEECGTLEDIPKDIRRDFTKDGSKYDIDHPFIQKTVKEIVGEERSPYWIMRKVFDYTRKQLEYELVGGWNSAPVVLRRKTGSCSEYSFSFIALCRAAGLPARYVGAYVVRGDNEALDDVFHRWPEVYLPNFGWVPVDPQGGDKSSPREQAMNIGCLSNRFLITTVGGGDSEYLGWYYNTYETFVSNAKTKVYVECFADWKIR